MRRFLNTLWNTYSFFVTYANLSEGWTADSGRQTVEVRSAVSGQRSDNLLDRWVLSELNRLVRDVTAAYENYDVLGATRPVADFVDSLSNWYVRLNRRRFWDGDPAALATLHQALVTVSQLLAPTTPFVADELYQNLVSGVDAAASDSVHLSRWPSVDPAAIDEQLSADMALAQKITTLGRAARENASLKVRQPLRQVVVRIRAAEEKAGLERMADTLLVELNVKGLAFTDGAGELVDVQVHPLPKQLGQKFGRGFPVVRQALAGMDQSDLAARFGAGESVTVEVDGTSYEVAPEDVEVRSNPRAGFSVAEDGGYLVAVTTDLTPELVLEGQAREVVRRVQQLRKDAGLDISDRIVLHLGESALLRALFEQHGGYVTDEVLAVETVWSARKLPADRVEFDLDGESVAIGLVKAVGRG